jgi:hypothetical protein
MHIVEPPGGPGTSGSKAVGQSTERHWKTWGSGIVPFPAKRLIFLNFGAFRGSAKKTTNSPSQICGSIPPGSGPRGKYVMATSGGTVARPQFEKYLIEFLVVFLAFYVAGEIGQATTPSEAATSVRFGRRAASRLPRCCCAGTAFCLRLRFRASL